MAVYVLSSGASFLRWLTEVDKKIIELWDSQQIHTIGKLLILKTSLNSRK